MTNTPPCPAHPRACLTPPQHEAFHVLTAQHPGDHIDVEDIDAEPGQFDSRLLGQDQGWIDTHGTRHRLEDMSPDHRANVLMLLDKQMPGIIDLTRTRLLFDAITGVIPALTARDQLDQLDLLTPGWAHHTPLGHRLHQLNRTRPDPVAPAHAWSTAAQSDHPETLRDEDSGQWHIDTASGTCYQIDLEQRRLRRLPDGNRHDPRTPPNGVRASRLSYDGQWLPLDTLIQCTLGRKFVALDLRPGNGGFCISTNITAIHRPPDPTPADRP